MEIAANHLVCRNEAYRFNEKTLDACGNCKGEHIQTIDNNF